MSTRIRGQEALISVTVDDEVAAAFGLAGQIVGSFFKVRDFTVTPRTDLTEEGFLGEAFDDIDIQHHGYDFSFTIDETDAAAINFLSLITYKESASLRPTEVGLTVSYTYRDSAVLPRSETYIGCLLKVASRTIGGRKEYIQTAIEGKAKDREVFIG